MNRILFIGLIFSVGPSFGQMVPADSLLGEYAGLMYYKSPLSNPWVITNDTLYVLSVDTINCSTTIISYSNNFGGTSPLYTTYYSCNVPSPVNVYFLFYNYDSLKMIFDSMVAPPPSPMYSREFFGKKISNKTMEVNELLNSEQVKVFPNPATDKFYMDIPSNIKTEISLLDVYGREVKTTRQKEMDVRDLKEGIYFLKVITEKGTTSKKVVIQR